MQQDGVLSARVLSRLNGHMAEPLVIQTLKDKRAEILGRIQACEAQIAAAKHVLAHVNATIRLFTEPERQRARYMGKRPLSTRRQAAFGSACRSVFHVHGSKSSNRLGSWRRMRRRISAR